MHFNIFNGFSIGFKSNKQNMEKLFQNILDSNWQTNLSAQNVMEESKSIKRQINGSSLSLLLLKKILNFFIKI